MTAQEAKELTIQKAITMEEVTQAIKNAASNGFSETVFFGKYLPDHLLLALAKDGYTTTRSKGPAGEQCIVISWA